MVNKTLKTIILFLTVAFTLSCAQEKSKTTETSFVSFINQEHAWVDSVFNSLTPKERIAQLFMVRAHSNLGQNYIDSVARVIEEEQLGGVVVFQGTPEGHVGMLNRYQKLTKVPLLTSIDGEWGLGMRLPDEAISYPYQMTLGAVQEDGLLRKMGNEIGKDLKRMGIHFNFAPTVDINNNPKNPVIGFRSFGDDKHKVTDKSEAYVKGLMDEGILASIKHFPGHGDTDVDSHFDLPQLNFTRERLDEVELFPFKELIDRGVPSVMVGHMHIPALDDEPHVSSSISRKIITDLLKKEMEFKGLIVTDAMSMKGVRKHFPGTEADVRTLQAGSDLLELSENSGKAIAAIEEALAAGEISQEEVDEKVKRVLATKYWLGLDTYQPTSTENLLEDIQREESKELVSALAEKAITVLNSKKGIDDFLPENKTAIIRIGIDENQDFESILSEKLEDVEFYNISEDEGEGSLNELLEKLSGYKQTIIAIHDKNARPRYALDYSDNMIRFLESAANENTITVLFTSPYILDELPVSKSASLVLGYQNDGFMQRAAAKVIMKEIDPSGKLSVTVNEEYKNGDGF
ncbi:MAG TPA: glycoside hydrolase family 3 N-terminal domain-containing protein [Sphingobacterium sp.]|nr:glycoside hydrolase family 3 N-terminal domain-containing protein [Sphingobacterium sp.]